jgi:hypothetical protein
VGAEVNWGVRFNENKDVCPFFHSCVIYHVTCCAFSGLILLCVSLQADHFLVNLSKEVSLRLQGCGLQGRTITLKVVSVDCTHLYFVAVGYSFITDMFCLEGENKKERCWRANKVYGMW